MAKYRAEKCMVAVKSLEMVDTHVDCPNGGSLRKSHLVDWDNILVGNQQDRRIGPTCHRRSHLDRGEAHWKVQSVQGFDLASLKRQASHDGIRQTCLEQHCARQMRLERRPSRWDWPCSNEGPELQWCLDHRNELL